MRLFTNNASTTLASGISDVATSLTVASGNGAEFPNPTSPDYFLATLEAGETREIVKVTARATDTFTVVRAQEGTAAVAWSSGDKIELRLTAGALQEFVVGPASSTDSVPALYDGTTGKLLKNSTPTGTGNPVLATSPTLVTPTLGVASATSLGITGTAGAGFIDLPNQSSQPGAPSAGVARIHGGTVNGFTRPEFHNESLADIIIGQDSVFVAKNTSGSAITLGQVVYVTGSVGNVPEVSLAKADAPGTISPTIGVATEASVANNGFGQFMVVGVLTGVNTSAFTTGASLFVSAATAGLLTSTAPAYPNFQKGIGIVLNVGVGNGSILINVAPYLGGTATGTNGNFTVAGTLTSSAVAITGGSISGITDLAVADGGTGASTAADAFSNLKQAASQTASGAVELATSAEIDTGTDSTRAMPVDQFVASARNVRHVLIRVVEATTNVAVATTKGGDVEIPFTGTITAIGAYVDTAGTTGTMTVDVNLNGTTIMTTNKITIDSTEKSSRTAATAPALTTTSVTAGNLFAVDIDAIQTTAAKGLTVRLEIRQA